MCGIAGWHLTEKPDDLFYFALASIMQARGEDSFGMLDLDQQTPVISRGIGAIASNVRPQGISCLRGYVHTRHATHGAINGQNSHPFEIGHLIGAHNGVIHNHTILNIVHSRKLEVDSMHIFAHMLEGKPLSELVGYGAIQVYNRNTNEIHIGACNFGELEVAKTSIGLVWASTKAAVEAAVFQAGACIETWYNTEYGKMYRVQSDALYESDLTFALTEKTADIKSTFEPASFGTLSAFDTRQQWEKDLDNDILKRMGHDDDTLEFDGDVASEEDLEEFDLVGTGTCELCGKQADLYYVYESFICEHCDAVIE